MDKLIAVAVIALGALCIVFLISCLYALPILLLWNWLMPAIFGLSKITFLQSLGISILSGMLFKSNVTTKSE